MAKPSKKSADEKLRVVLSVLRGEATATDAARRAGVSEQTVHNWKRLFLDSGRDGLAAQGRSRRSGREAELEASGPNLSGLVQRKGSPPPPAAAPEAPVSPLRGPRRR